jgi:hypothetical protein
MKNDVEKNIDEIMKFLRDKNEVYGEPKGNITTSLLDLKSKIGFDDIDLMELFEILREDGYVSYAPGDYGKITLCKVKYKGKIFIDSGGYVEKLARMASHDREIRTIRRGQFFLTLVLAAAALIEVLKYFRIYPHFCH